MELTLVLLAAALVLFASVVCSRLSARVGMPVQRPGDVLVLHEET